MTTALKSLMLDCYIIRELKMTLVQIFCLQNTGIKRINIEGQFEIKVTKKFNKKRKLCRQKYILKCVKAAN